MGTRGLQLRSTSHQEEDDDDLWKRYQVQGLHRLRHADSEERGFHEHDEGSWSQRPPWHCWCWCARWIRQVPVPLHRVENWCLRKQLQNKPRPPSKLQRHALATNFVEPSAI